jgi:putative toxin-antitoxin system antitoxin component (TIGR02293 family)
MSTTETIPDIRVRRRLDKEISSMVRQSVTNKRSLNIKGDITYSEFLQNKMLIIHIIRQGVPYTFFNLIRHYSPFSENEWAGFLDISLKSLHRYKLSSKRFKPLQSEKIIEMSEVLHVGLDFFGDMDTFKRWLDTPNFALGSLKPQELLKDSYGKELIIAELTRISYGIFV